MQNAELEGRQKLWRWLILAAIGVLIVETWLAGRLGRTRPTRGGPDDMSTRTAAGVGTGRASLPQVRLWSGLALCWLAWALVGGRCLRSWQPGCDRCVSAPRLLAALAAVAARHRLRRSSLRSARDPRWVARRIEAKHPELGTGLLAAVEEDCRQPRAGWVSCRPP